MSELIHRTLDDQVQAIQTDEKLRQAQRLEAIGQLTGGIAHDFNNILTGVIGYTTIAMNQAPDEGALNDTLHIIYRKAHEAAQLVQQLLAFSRKQILNKQPLSLNGRIQEALRFLRRVVRDNIEFEDDLADLSGTVLADSTALQQIITNLCVNAQDALPSGGVIIFRTRRVEITEDLANKLEIEPGDYAQLSIVDDGIGMDTETRMRIFEPFFTTKESGQGTGLGLATVYGLVKQHDGAIHCESQPGKGTRFDIYLPLSLDQEVKKSSEPGLDIVKGRETILVVENDPDVLTVVRSYLQMAGYETLTAEDGVEGLKLFGRREADIDLVLTDIIMPGLTGIELSTYINKIKSTTPVVFMTGYADNREIEALGPETPILQKPLTAGALTQLVRKLLDAAH